MTYEEYMNLPLCFQSEFHESKVGDMYRLPFRSTLNVGENLVAAIVYKEPVSGIDKSKIKNPHISLSVDLFKIDIKKENLMFEFDEGIICPKDPTATKKRIKQYKEYYKVKYKLCKDQNPKKIAEIGVRAGYSAWTFLQACPEAQYIGYDANNGTHGGQGGQNGMFFKWAQKILGENATLHQLNTQKVNFLDLKDVDFFHVDGDHTTKGVKHDLTLAYNCLSDDGLIVVDDITYIKEVKRGVKQWLEIYSNFVTHEFVKSFRGEMLIRKK